MGEGSTNTKQKVDYLAREFPFAGKEAIAEGVAEFEMARRKHANAL